MSARPGTAAVQVQVLDVEGQDGLRLDRGPQPLHVGLAEAGEQVTAASRRAGELPGRVRYLAAGLADPQSLRPALDGARALFPLVAGDDPQGILDLARTTGVRRVVLLSSQGAGTRPEVYRHPVAFEEAVRRSGLDWTILPSGGLN